MEQTPMEMLEEWYKNTIDANTYTNRKAVLNKITELLAAEKERELLIASKSWDAADNFRNQLSSRKIENKSLPTAEEILRKNVPTITFDKLIGTPIGQVLKSMEEYASQYRNLHNDGWVDVKDGLPEFDKLVMVFGIRKLSQPSMGGNPPQVTFTQRQNLFGTSLEESKFRYVDKNDFRLMEDVTHWQYLPTPPKP